MNKLSKGSCHTYHADAPEAYYRSIKFWKTPVADCGNGQKNCMDYKWVNAWRDDGLVAVRGAARRAPRSEGPPPPLRAFWRRSWLRGVALLAATRLVCPRST